MTVSFRCLVVVSACLAAAIGTPAASASISPKIGLDQSAGTAAGSMANLGVKLSFAPTGTDSPQHLTLVLPPGLLANASIDGGACLTMKDLTDSACKVGSGTVTAFPNGLDVPITVPVAFDLVPPPAPGDLAGIAVSSSGTQIGATAGVRIRPSGDPAGVGVTLSFLLPNSLAGEPISISQINSTFDGLRYPATCPASPQLVTLAVDSYDDPSTQTASAPLQVTDCSVLPFAPSLQATVTRDVHDHQAQVVTDITQPRGQAPSGSITLALPEPALGPDLLSLKSLCATPQGGHCTPVGSVVAVSPLYPRPLAGLAYLTGSFKALSLTLKFPSPFPLTLTGVVDIAQNGTTFTGLPDIPLGELDVTLYGGRYGLFAAGCLVRSGTATATLTDANGDRTVQATSGVTVAGCPAPKATAGRPRLTRAALTTLHGGRLRLTLKVLDARHARPVSALQIELPRPLAFLAHRRRGRPHVIGVRLAGARLRRAHLVHGRLALVLRRPSRRVAVTIGPHALQTRGSLHGRRLTATVIVRTGRRGRFELRRRIALLHHSERAGGTRTGARR